MKKLPSPRKRAILLACLMACVLLASLGYLLIAPGFQKKDRLVADIYQNGILLRTIPLSSVTETETFSIRGEHGAENVIEVRPGSIAVISASCPDQICVHQGFREDSLLPITCLPNHLVIQIRQEGSEKTAETDALTY